MADGQPFPDSLFVYAPNKVAPVIFATLYGLSAEGHIWQCYRYKCFRLIGLHPLCAVMFAVGYALREFGAFNYIYNDDNTGSLIPFILSQVFIYICPPLLELANYHVLSRILHYVPHLAPLPPSRVSTIFGSLLGVVELLNSLGVALSAKPTSTPATQGLGRNLTIAALSMQLGLILIFVLIAGAFHLRCARASIRARAVSTPLMTLYASMVLILIRCIYRLIEHLGDTTLNLDDPESLKKLSPILRYEWFFYVFEATLMLLNSLLWNVWNPGRYMPSNPRVYLAPDGMTEVEHEKAYKQPLLVTIGSVLTFGIVGAVHRRRHARKPFGELQDYPGSHRRLATQE